MDSVDPITLSLELGGQQDIDPSDLDKITRALRSELEDLPFGRDVDITQSKEGAAPAGGKKGPGELITVGSLLMAVMPVAIPKLIEFLKDWGLRPGNVPVKIKAQAGDRSVEVEFDPDNMSAAAVKQLAADLGALVQK